MMDLGYLPAPPPEEFEESSGEVPLPPSDWDHGNGSPYVSYSSASSSTPDAGAAWQRAMDALSQTQPSKPGFGPYGASSYGPMMPAPNWPQPSYGYASNYHPSYSTPPSSMYAGQFNHPTAGLGHQRAPTAHYGQAPPPGYHVPAAPQQAHSHEAHSYNVPPQQSSGSANNVASFLPRTPQNSFGSRNRMLKPRYSPYAAAPSSTSGISSYGQRSVVSEGPSSSYQSYHSGPPVDSSSVLVGDGSSSGMGHDMEIDEDAGQGFGSTGYAQHYPQKQAPGAGGIRFQLSKKNAEVKVSNPLLQRRPLFPAPRSSTTTTNGSTVGSSVSSKPQSSSSADLLSNVQSKDWPASLQEYVTKAIRITPSEKHEQVMHTITQMIANAYKTNTLFSVKWEMAPMPYANESSNELFGLSPKRENESPPPSSSSTFRSRFAPSGSRGRVGGRSTENFRRGRVSGRRSSESEGGSASPSRSKFSSSKGHGKANTSSSRRRSDEEAASPEVDYLPLHGAKGGGAGAGKKGKVALKQGKNAQAGQAGPRGKLMGFGTEAPKSAEDLEKLRKRQERFSAGNSGASPSLAKPLSKPKKNTSKSPSASALRGQSGARRALSTIRTVVGTCQTVEKEYFRLTEAVDASQVRPVAVLEQALALVRAKWKREHNYRYAESQLKSIRQDLRVQHVFSAFTVQVYETHARIGLEVGDQAEFTQCLSQLEWLYDTLTAVHRAEKSSSGVPAGCENRREFLSYRILYVMRQNRTTDVTRVRMQLSEEDKKDICIAFAFSVLSAYFAGDYQQFFSLYKIAPLMAGYVMEVSIPQFRQRIFVKICTAYRPNLPVTALKEILRFSNEAELRDFLKAYKLTYTWMSGLEEIDCKASLPVVKAGPEAVIDGKTPSKPQPVSLRPTSKTRRKIKA